MKSGRDVFPETTGITPVAFEFLVRKYILYFFRSALLAWIGSRDLSFAVPRLVSGLLNKRLGAFIGQTNSKCLLCFKLWNFRALARTLSEMHKAQSEWSNMAYENHMHIHCTSSVTHHTNLTRPDISLGGMLVLSMLTPKKSKCGSGRIDGNICVYKSSRFSFVWKVATAITFTPFIQSFSWKKD
jgi:hypothetical protein